VHYGNSVTTWTIYTFPSRVEIRGTVIVFHVTHSVTLLLCNFWGAFAKMRKATVSFIVSVCLSVSPHGTTRLPLGGFS